MDKDLIGMTVEAAVDWLKTHNYKHRIVRQDERRFMVTMDYRPDRRNLTIENGIVTKVKRG